MAYVKRDASGALIAVSSQDDGTGWEAVPPGSPAHDIVTRSLQQSHDLLSGSDLSIARVLEDLIDLLVDKGVIRFTDFPEAAQAKLAERRGARASMRGGLSLLHEDGDAI